MRELRTVVLRRLHLPARRAVSHVPQPRCRAVGRSGHRDPAEAGPLLGEGGEMAAGVESEIHGPRREGARLERAPRRGPFGNRAGPEEGPRGLGEGGPFDLEGVRGRILLDDVRGSSEAGSEFFEHPRSDLKASAGAGGSPKPILHPLGLPELSPEVSEYLPFYPGPHPGGLPPHDTPRARATLP